MIKPGKSSTNRIYLKTFNVPETLKESLDGRCFGRLMWKQTVTTEHMSDIHVVYSYSTGTYCLSRSYFQTCCSSKGFAPALRRSWV